MKAIILFFTLCLIACSSNTKIIEVQNDDGTIIERYSQNIKTGQKEGKSELYTNSGQLLETATYQNGQLHGKRELFHENGAIQAIEQYENGAFKGLYQAYYENEQLELEGNYENGKMEGEWKRYYDTGELMEIVTFAGNEENGPFIEYYKNGNKKTIGTYLNGDNEQGELQIFDEDGDLVKKMNCEKGLCRTSWSKEQNERKM